LGLDLLRHHRAAPAVQEEDLADFYEFLATHPQEE
jgi:hypothetical protein